MTFTSWIMRQFNPLHNHTTGGTIGVKVKPVPVPAISASVQTASNGGMLDWRNRDFLQVTDLAMMTKYVRSAP